MGKLTILMACRYRDMLDGLGDFSVVFVRVDGFMDHC